MGAPSAATRVHVAIVSEQEDGSLFYLTELERLSERFHPGYLAENLGIALHEGRDPSRDLRFV